MAEPQPEPAPEPAARPFPSHAAAPTLPCLLLCAPDGRRALGSWGPSLYTDFVLPEARACLQVAAEGELAHRQAVDDALRALDTHREAHSATGSLGGERPAAPAPLPLSLPEGVAEGVARRQVLGDCLRVVASGDSVEAMLTSLQLSGAAVPPPDGRLCVAVQAWGGDKMSSKSKHRLAARCLEAAGLGQLPRVGVDAALPTDTLFVCAVVHEGPLAPVAYFGHRSQAAARFLHSLRRLDVAERPLLGDAPTRPPLALAMVNMAQLRRGAVVLDPFVGSGALMLAAAELGAHVLGGDNDPNLLFGADDDGAAERTVHANFDQLGLPRPELFCADMLARGCGALVGRRRVDAIITDPPFGLRFPPWRMGVRPRQLSFPLPAPCDDLGPVSCSCARRRRTQRAGRNPRPPALTTRL